MQLEEAACFAALSFVADERALATIALVDLTHDRARNVT